MSSRVSPTRQPQFYLPIRTKWDSPMANLEDAKFLRSWLVYDSSLDQNRTSGRFNWNAALGFGLITVVSVGIWAGTVILISHLLK